MNQRINQFQNKSDKNKNSLTPLSGVGVLFLFFLIISSFTNLQAQDSIFDRNVTVEREYKPVIKDAGKINSAPEVLEQTVVKSAPTYSDFNLPLNADFNIHILSAAELALQKRINTENGFARFGLGSNLNTLADFAYPIVNTQDIKLDFSLNHLGTFDAKAHSTTKAALSFDKYFNSLVFYAGLGGGHEYLKYYGNNFDQNNKVVSLDSLSKKYYDATYQEQNLNSISRTPQTVGINSLAKDSTSETFWRYNAFVGIRSLPLSEGMRYLAEVQYKVFNSLNGLSENLIQTKAGFSTMSDENRLGLDLEMYNLMYHSNNPALLNFWDAFTVFAMNPYYSFERKTWNVRLGVKSSFSFIHGKPFNPSPDVSAEWKAVPKYFSIYGGITGGYQVNTMNDMFSENRYLFPDVRVQDTYTPYDFYAGVKLKPIYNLLIDGYVDYRSIDNQYFFVNKEYALTSSTVPVPPVYSTLFTNRFNVIYSSATVLKVGARANYNLQNWLNVQLKGSINNWTVATETHAWNQPNWEANLSTSVKLTPDFSVDANVYLDDGRYAKLGNTAILMNPRIDINLGASYSYNNWFTAFAKVNNVINNSYQDFYGYDVQGFNVLVGAAFSF